MIGCVRGVPQGVDRDGAGQQHNVRRGKDLRHLIGGMFVFQDLGHTVPQLLFRGLPATKSEGHFLLYFENFLTVIQELRLNVGMDRALCVCRIVLIRISIKMEKSISEENKNVSRVLVQLHIIFISNRMLKA